MTNVIHLGRPLPKPQEPEIIDTSALAMSQLEGSLDLLKDQEISGKVMERALEKGIDYAIQLLRRELKDLISLKRSMEASCHE